MGSKMNITLCCVLGCAFYFIVHLFISEYILEHHMCSNLSQKKQLPLCSEDTEQMIN